MALKRIFIMIAAVALTSAAVADNAIVASKKYVDDFMVGYQDKIPGAGNNKLMIYDESPDGIGEKDIVSLLGSNTNATDVPNVGAVLNGLDGKQDTINGTVGYVMTGTGTAGNIGEKPIYSPTTNYSDALVTAESVNSGVINAVNASLILVDTDGHPSDNGTLWQISDDLLAINAKVPYGYTELQYIVFDGSQTIDTGFKPNQDTKIVSKFNGASDAVWVYGAGGTNPRITCYLGTTGNQRFGNVTVVNTGISANTINVVTQDKNGFNLNGNLTPYTDVGSFSVKKTLTIGNSNGATSVSYFNGSFYYMKIYNNGTLVRNMIPAKRDSDSKVGMYDIVNNVFYPNAVGTDFTAGPSCVSPNLFDKTQAITGKILKSSGAIADNDRYDVSEKLYLPNGTYTFSQANTYTTSGTLAVAYTYDANDNPLHLVYSVNAADTLQQTFTLTGDYSYIRFSYRGATASNVQLEKGSTATTYRPYGENICY